MRGSLLGALLFLAATATAASAANSVSLVSVETYGNYHAGGVVATVTGDDNRNGSAELLWRPAGEGALRAGHPLTRVDATHFVGSLFWLTPGRQYEIQVQLFDPDGLAGGPAAGAILTTRPDTLAEPAGRILYVSPTGNDAAPGTDPASPLRTIQRGANLAQPGDLVLIQPGVYRESVMVPRSGTATQPIVFRGSAPGAILDGADGAIAAGVPWTGVGSGVYSYLAGFPTGHVVSDQGRLYRYASVSALQSLGAGAPGGFYSDGTTLYVKFADGSSPATRTLHAARFEDGFSLDGVSHVRIENLEIRHYGAGDYGKGVYLRYRSSVAVRRCRLHDVEAAGVWVKGGEMNLIEENEIWDTSIFGWPWGFSKGSSAENTGVLFTDNIGRGNVVRRNTIHGTFNGIGPCGSSAPAAGVTSETDVYENVLFQHTDDGMEPEGYCSNVRIWRNTIRDAHMVFAVAPAAPGPTYFVRNVGYRFGNTRTSQQDGYTASALKVNSGYSTPVGPVFLYHNTFATDAPNTDAMALLNPGSSTFIRARNNVLAATRYALYKVNPVVLDWDWDDLFTTDPARFASWQGARYGSLDALQAGTGQELHGLAAAPGFANPASGDLTLSAGSPLVDRGLPIPGVNDGFSGRAPDLGAFERAADSDRPPAPTGLRTPRH
jgi:hypothetical protein